ncbi:MAG: hypothetical protein COA97_09655 [Flavobacteriales bacterium]|nr:MAG: hypothetical protein COA97_09655 [Flavobacteriales bacterium]
MGNNDKLFKIINYSLLGLSAVLGIYFFAFTDFDLSPNGNVPTNSGLMLTYTYVLTLIAALTAIIFSVIGMAKNLKKAKNALIGVGALAIIFVIGYAMAGNEVHINYDGAILAEAGTSMKSEAGIIASFILLAGAVGAIIFSEVSKLFK